MTRHPIQPLEKDAHGVIRFKANKIVQRLLEEGGIDLNKIAVWASMGEVSREDQEQFAQLIGYSHSGAGDLSCMSNEVLSAAQAQYEAGTPEMEARLAYANETLESVRAKLKDGVAELFGVHPDDLDDMA